MVERSSTAARPASSARSMAPPDLDRVANARSAPSAPCGSPSCAASPHTASPSLWRPASSGCTCTGAACPAVTAPDLLGEAAAADLFGSQAAGEQLDHRGVPVVYSGGRAMLTEDEGGFTPGPRNAPVLTIGQAASTSSATTCRPGDSPSTCGSSRAWAHAEAGRATSA